ncbi:hypothetical protein DW2_15330 [Thioclava atlantica]|uniref:Uncharacterized protein n=1 Tax=Thioclava atlantica TaxID=1317124 RepID=A0A085TT03_9RHOB|nr:hypothetical protein DW2_15330 [Thioclava atlantica]
MGGPAPRLLAEMRWRRGLLPSVISGSPHAMICVKACATVFRFFRRSCASEQGSVQEGLRMNGQRRREDEGAHGPAFQAGELRRPQMSKGEASAEFGEKIN